MERKAEWFAQARFGLFIHWGLYAIPARGEWDMFNSDIDPGTYRAYMDRFNPVDFDPGYWADLAWDAGMRYVVFTTRHHDGFCMYNSRQTDFNIMNTPYGRDITAELTQAFRARGHRIGFYHSLPDWQHPHFMPDQEHPLWRKGEREWPTRDMAIYREYLHKNVRQILTDYGKIDLLFLDYTSKWKKPEDWDAEVLRRLVYDCQPDILLNDRLSYDKKSFPGDFGTAELCVPTAPVEIGGRQAEVWEACITLNDNWGYARNYAAYKPIESVLGTLLGCASRNGNLLLNVGPDARGRLPKESVEQLGKLAEWMDLYRDSLHGSTAAELTPPFNACYTQKGNRLFLHLLGKQTSDIILPGLKDQVRHATMLGDGADVPQIMQWGTDSLKAGELRLRLPNRRLDVPVEVVEITLK
jgi:alpha-L-fucosidase